ncbi:hypothetical protein PAMA_017487 [Pampus argenteus]
MHAHIGGHGCVDRGSSSTTATERRTTTETRRGSSSPKVQFRDWPRVDVLIQKCLWLREMSCPVPLRGAYIIECRAVDPGGINRRKAIT